MWTEPRLPRPTGEVTGRDKLESGGPHTNLGLLAAAVFISLLVPSFTEREAYMLLLSG